MIMPHQSSTAHDESPVGRVTPVQQVPYSPLAHQLLTHVAYGGAVLRDGTLIVLGVEWTRAAYLESARLLFGNLVTVTQDFLGSDHLVLTPPGVGTLARWDRDLGGAL